MIRKNSKCVPLFGVEGVWNRIHHRNAIDKILCLCVCTYVPHNNDPRAGGRAAKLTMTRAGGMVQAKKDSFGRVYNDDGTISYPPVPENRLREKGKYYCGRTERSPAASRLRRGRGSSP